MSDISLLMTGVLTTGQASPPQLPEEPVIQLENGGQELTVSQETNLVSTVKITPPEFMQSDGIIHAAPSAPALNNENIFSIITEKIQSKGFYSLVKSLDSGIATEFGNATETLLQNGSVLRDTLLKHLSKESNNESVEQKMNLRVLLASTSFSDWRKATENATNATNINVNYLSDLPIIEVFSQQQWLADTQGINSKFVARSLKYHDITLPILRFGSSGGAVKVLQRLLLSNGYAIRVDGVFGALTEAAIKAFQNKHTLPADGIVGSRTWNELTK
jgi:Putative peptidoglycan binding domain